jgi:hypothetical protein
MSEETEALRAQLIRVQARLDALKLSSGTPVPTVAPFTQAESSLVKTTQPDTFHGTRSKLPAFIS